MSISKIQTYSNTFRISVKNVLEDIDILLTKLTGLHYCPPSDFNLYSTKDFKPIFVKGKTYPLAKFDNETQRDIRINVEFNEDNFEYFIKYSLVTKSPLQSADVYKTYRLGADIVISPPASSLAAELLRYCAMEFLHINLPKPYGFRGGSTKAIQSDIIEMIEKDTGLTKDKIIRNNTDLLYIDSIYGKVCDLFININLSTCANDCNQYIYNVLLNDCFILVDRMCDYRQFEHNLITDSLKDQFYTDNRVDKRNRELDDYYYPSIFDKGLIEYKSSANEINLQDGLNKLFYRSDTYLTSIAIKV